MNGPTIHRGKFGAEVVHVDPCQAGCDGGQVEQPDCQHDDHCGCGATVQVDCEACGGTSEVAIEGCICAGCAELRGQVEAEATVSP